jgi:uncharacterized protein YcfL
MKNLTLIAAIIPLLLNGCAMSEKTSKLTVSMLLFNQEESFVSEGFAKRLALLVIEEKYPKDIFIRHEGIRVLDQGEAWQVMIDNALVDTHDSSALPIIEGKIVPKSLSILINKANGAIIKIF